MAAREARCATIESKHAALIAQRDTEIASLREHLAEMQASVTAQIHHAISKREDELRAAVLRREEEVAEAMQRREEEIMEAVRRREAEVEEAWRRREVEIREECAKEMEERWNDEWEKLENMRMEVEERMMMMEDAQKRGGKRNRRINAACYLTFSSLLSRQEGEVAAGGSQEHPCTPCTADERITAR